MFPGSLLGRKRSCLVLSSMKSPSLADDQSHLPWCLYHLCLEEDWFSSTVLWAGSARLKCKSRHSRGGGRSAHACPLSFSPGCQAARTPFEWCDQPQSRALSWRSSSIPGVQQFLSTGEVSKLYYRRLMHILRQWYVIVFKFKLPQSLWSLTKLYYFRLFQILRAKIVQPILTT